MNALTYLVSHLTTPVEAFRVNKRKEVGSTDSQIKHELPVTATKEDHSITTEISHDEKKDPHDSITLDKQDEITTAHLMITSILQSRIFQIFWSAILFLPKYLIMKPIMLAWFVITLPLTLVERGIKLRNRPNKKEKIKTSELRVLNPIVEEDLANGDEFIFQRDIIKGSFIKTSKFSHSPSSKLKLDNFNSKSENHSDITSNSSNIMFGSKKMGKFLFPKKLIPKSIMCTGRKKTLVIDLDETLIHSVSRGTTHVNSSQGHIVEVRFSSSGVSTLYYVHKRPHCDLFLSKVSDWYNIVIFTASMKEYADPVIDWLEGSFPGTFSRRLYRKDCTLRDGVGYIKDLSILTKSTHQNSKFSLPETGLNEIIIIDNSPVSYAMHVDNAIQVEGWINDPTDTDLLNLLPLLQALRYTTDVRNILSLKNGEKSFGVN